MFYLSSLVIIYLVMDSIHLLFLKNIYLSVRGLSYGVWDLVA